MVQERRLGRVRVALVSVLALGIVGCGAGGHKSASLGDGSIKSIKVVATGSADRGPVDAAPAPDGSVFYFTANGTGGPGVVAVPGTGGATFTLTTGTPLVHPVGLAVATDGKSVFVADPGASRVFSVPSGGGPATTVAGTEGRSPRGLDVTVAGGHDVIYFTGTDPADGAAGLFSIPAAGGTPTVVTKGAPLVSPDAVVVAGDVAYVTDRGTGSAAGAVLKVSNGRAVNFAGARLGDPGGISLTRDNKTLLISSQNATTGADQVLLIDVATGRSGVASKVIGANHDSSGGLHRAYRSAVFAWADVSRSGRVYRVDPNT
jgi:sugar lactone lactonase YvrE